MRRQSGTSLYSLINKIANLAGIFNSTFFDNVGTDKYKRVYAEVSRKKKDSGKKPSNVMQVEEKCHYVGSGMVIR